MEIFAGFIFVGCVTMAIISAFMVVINEAKNKLEATKSALRMLLGSLLVGMVGYGICAMSFNMGAIH